MNNLRAARERVGLSQKEVAITLKVSAPTVSEWESGKKNPNSKNLKKLSEIYKASTDYLIGQTGNSLYVEPNDNRLHSNRPIDILTCMYHVNEDVLSSIVGVDESTAEKWITGNATPSSEEYNTLAEFFEVPVEELKRGVLPLFPKESVQLRVLELTDIRYAAYGKEGDFTVDEIKKIKDFADIVRRASGGRTDKE